MIMLTLTWVRNPSTFCLILKYFTLNFHYPQVENCMPFIFFKSTGYLST